MMEPMMTVIPMWSGLVQACTGAFISIMKMIIGDTTVNVIAAVTGIMEAAAIVAAVADMVEGTAVGMGVNFKGRK